MLWAKGPSWAGWRGHGVVLAAACECFGVDEAPRWLGQVGVVTQAAVLPSAWLVVAPRDVAAAGGQAAARLAAERGPVNGTGPPWQPQWRRADSQQLEFATRCGQLPHDGAAGDAAAVHPLLQTSPCSP